MKYIPKFQTPSGGIKPLVGLPPDKLPDMFGKSDETPQRYLMRLYNSPRIKKIVASEKAPPDEYTLENIKELKNWEKNKKKMPEIFDDAYKKTMESLVKYSIGDTRDPIDIILGTQISMKNPHPEDKSTFGFSTDNGKIYVFPYKHKNSSQFNLKSTTVHELSHQLYPATAGHLYGDNPIKNYFTNTSFQYGLETLDDDLNYLGSASEKLARVNELRYNLDKKGIYDATKRDFTSEDYDAMVKLNDPIINRLIDELHFGSFTKFNGGVTQLPIEKRKENIIKLLNIVAENKSKKAPERIQMAQKGKALTKDQQEEMKNNLAPKNIHTGQKVITPYEQYLNQTEDNKKSELAEFIKKRQTQAKAQSDVYKDPGTGETTIQNIGIKPSASPLDLGVGLIAAGYVGGTAMVGQVLEAVNPIPFIRTQQALRRLGNSKVLEEFTLNLNNPLRGTYKNKDLNRLKNELQENLTNDNFEKIYKEFAAKLPSEYKLPIATNKPLGSGVFGTVYPIPKTKLVVKLGRATPFETEESFKYLSKVGKDLKNKNLGIPIQSTFYGNGQVAQVMPRISGVSLDQANGVAEENIKNVMTLITQLRSKGVHADYMSPKNFRWNSRTKTIGLVDLNTTPSAGSTFNTYNWVNESPSFIEDILSEFARVGKYKDKSFDVRPIIDENLGYYQKGGNVNPTWQVKPDPYNLKTILDQASGKSATDLIKGFESFRSSKYLDSKGIPTIGYGTTDKKYVKKGKISEEEAEKAMQEYIATNITPILSKKPYYSKLYPSQKTALTSLIYNIGPTQFNNSKKLQAALMKQDWNAAMLEMNHGMNDPSSPGLVKRRLQEQAIFAQNLQ